MLPLNNIILLSSRIHPSVEDLTALDAQVAQVADWEEVVRNLIERGVGPLFYTKLSQLNNRTLIPAGSLEKLRQAYYLTLSRGMVLYDVFRKAVGVLKANDIDLMVLKGAYLAEKLYGDIALRQFSDIDLLIREDDGEKAQAVLREAGFQSEDYPMAAFLRQQLGFEHYPQMIYKGGAVELHVRLSRPGEHYEILTENVWQHAETVTLQGIEVKVPDLTDVLIHTCVHLHKHFREGQIQFTGFSDIVNLLHIHADAINWEELSERCRLYRCEEIVFTYVILASKYYRINLPVGIVSNYEHCLKPADEELFLSYLSGFTGRHYSVQSKMKGVHQLEGTEMKLKYLIWMMFPSKKYMVTSYKIKNPGLYWCYYPYRYWIGLKGLWRMVRKPL